MTNNSFLSTLDLSDAICAAFQAAIETVKRTAGSALRVTFRKADGSIRQMDIAYDPDMGKDIRGTHAEATAKRAATNELRKNMVVRERLVSEDNGKTITAFQWRTIPCRRIISVCPCM